MTREEQIREAALVYSFDTDGGHTGDLNTGRDDFMEGAEWADAHPVNPWHNVADGDLPADNTYCLFLVGIDNIERGHVMDGCVHFDSTEKPWMLKDMDYWMEIPKTPSE